MAREVKEAGFGSESLKIAANVAFPGNGRAMDVYIKQLAHTIARALRE